MHLVPKPGHVYRRTDTGKLVGAEGDDFDPCDLDVVRAREVGDLISTEDAPKAPKAKRAKAEAKAAPPPAPESSEA